MPFVCNFSFWRPCLGPAADSFLNQPAVRVVFASPKVRYAHGALVCCFATFSSTKSKQKKGDPAVCDPCGANLRRGVCGVRRITHFAAAQLRSDKRGESDDEACARRRACHPANAPPQAQPEGSGQPKSRAAKQPNSQTATRAIASLGAHRAGASATRCANWAERSDGPKGCPASGSLQDAPRSAAASGSGLAIV